MAPVRLSHTWARRLYVGLFLLSLGFLTLFGLQYTGIVGSDQFQLDIISAVGSVATLILSIIGFSVVKKMRTFILSFFAYLLFALTTLYIVQQTGGISSPFLAVWSIAAFIAAVFGMYGWLPVFVVTGVYTAMIYINGEFSAENVSIVVLASLLPAIAGMFIWRETPDAQDPAEKDAKTSLPNYQKLRQNLKLSLTRLVTESLRLTARGRFSSLTRLHRKR